VKIQQELLRHADDGATMNLYTQAVSEQKRAVHSSVVRLVLPEFSRKDTRLDISGQGRKSNGNTLSSLMVGAIGFESAL
jgi:hypothetical protein